MYSNHPVQIILPAQSWLLLALGSWLSGACARQEYLGAPGWSGEAFVSFGGSQLHALSAVSHCKRASVAALYCKDGIGGRESIMVTNSICIARTFFLKRKKVIPSYPKKSLKFRWVFQTFAWTRTWELGIKTRRKMFLSVWRCNCHL